MENLSVYTVPPSPPRWDQVGVFYLSFCVTWTTLVFGGMIFCLCNRRSPVLKLRGLPLSFAAITFLHAYWILGQLVYPIGATMPLILAYDVQYFFMGIWFPLGIALFHASNSRFLHIAKLQKQFAHPDLRKRTGCNGASTSWLCRIRNMGFTKRMMLFIGMGMVIQVLLTVGMWLACKKYHPTYGIPGTELQTVGLLAQLVELGRGWEWWPSVLWQVIWTWIVAPILIFRAWGIRDTMGWRTQTIGCCLSNLHATPMFLIATYVPAFAEVNAYFAPSQWIHASVFMFEVFTVFVPVFQVLRLWTLNKIVEDSNAKWETSSMPRTLGSSSSSGWKLSMHALESGQTLDLSDPAMNDRLFTMSALDLVLNDNPGPLQDFSALSDFSGENIAFLTSVSAWKATLPPGPNSNQRRDAYHRALEIFTTFISPSHADFPLNLSSTDLKELQDIFDQAATSFCGEAGANMATPFDVDEVLPLGQACGRSSYADVFARSRYAGVIPESFQPAVFDRAHSHIKYLVLTNTWPKFVRDTQQRKRSSETERSDFTFTSQATLISQVSSHLTKFYQLVF